MKKLVGFIIAFGIVTNVFAIGVGKLKINPEVGVSLGTSTPSDTFLVGGYGRVWLGGDGLTIAPQFKYNYVSGENSNKGFSNMQIGGLLGYRIFRFTPYIGVSYSDFDGINLASTTALNYGVYFDIPILPLSVGIDASYQNPKITHTNSRQAQHQFAVTIALIF